MSYEGLTPPKGDLPLFLNDYNAVALWLEKNKNKIMTE